MNDFISSNNSGVADPILSKLWRCPSGRSQGLALTVAQQPCGHHGMTAPASGVVPRTVRHGCGMVRVEVRDVAADSHIAIALGVANGLIWTFSLLG